MQQGVRCHGPDQVHQPEPGADVEEAEGRQLGQVADVSNVNLQAGEEVGDVDAGEADKNAADRGISRLKKTRMPSTEMIRNATAMPAFTRASAPCSRCQPIANQCTP